MNLSCLCSPGMEVTNSNSSNSRNASIIGSPNTLIQPRSESLEFISDTHISPSHPPEGHSQENSTSRSQYERSAPLSHQQLDDNMMFNSFNFWRPPLPDITQDLQLLQGQERDVTLEENEQITRETEADRKEIVPSLDAQGPATSSQIQKVLDCLQPHLDDPDVQGEFQKELMLFCLFLVEDNIRKYSMYRFKWIFLILYVS